MKNVDEVAIFWDYENCPAPASTSGYAIVNNIRSVAQNFGGVKLFKAYLEVTEQVPVSRTAVLRSELQSSGVSLTDCPHNGRKDVADKMIIVDMLAHAIDNPAPSTIVLISGDRDFAYALSILRLRRYRVVLITLSNAHQSLRAQASISFDWVSEVLEAVDPSVPHQPTSPRRGKLSSSPAHDKFYSDSMGHNLPSSLFQESYDEKPASNVEFMNNFQHERSHEEIPRTPPKRDSLPPALETTCVSSDASGNGPEAPARVMHSPVASCHAYIDRSIQTPLSMTACSSESSSSRTTPRTAAYGSITPSRHSGLREFAAHSPELIGSMSIESAMQKLRADKKLQESSHQYPVINGIRVPSSVADDVNYPGSPLDISPLANVSTTPTAPIPPPLSAATVSAIAQISANPRRPAVSVAVPDKFKILVKCLKSHRSRGTLSPLRSKISSEIAENGTTYRQAGVSSFGEYVAMAEKAGIVELGGSALNAWIVLKAPWYNARLS